jgi:hypothetical protein
MFGCFGFLVAMGIAGWAAWVFLIQPARSLVDQFQQVIGLERTIQNQQPYAAPTSKQLTQAQVQRFVQVQREVKRELGQRYQRIEARLNQLANQQVGQLSLDYRTALDLFTDSGTLIVDAKKVQVAAVNRARFSAEEYTWVRNQTYAALGYGVPTLNPQEILRQIGQRDFNTTVTLPKPDAPPANVRLVEPFRNELVSYYPFTWFGL